MLWYHHGITRMKSSTARIADQGSLNENKENTNFTVSQKFKFAVKRPLSTQHSRTISNTPEATLYVKGTSRARHSTLEPFRSKDL